MKGIFCAGAVLLGIAAISACTTPFSERIRYDPSIANAPGTIVLGEPRVFTREDLISERVRDTAYLQRLIEESQNPERVSFRPELNRELETITAAALAFGVKSDPLAATANRRNAETNEILHEIDRLKIEHALEQLKRDIEIRRASLATQTEPVNTGLGTIGNDAAVPMTVGTSAADQLKASIDNLLAAITGRLDIEGKQPAKTSVASNPLDEYRDRTAYRGMLKGELNAASLDQMHDAGNARLMRLNFEASVIPVEKYLHSLGAVQVQVIPPGEGSPTEILLDNWLTYINRDRLITNDPQSRKDSLKAELIASNRFKEISLGKVSLVLPVVLDMDGHERTPDFMLGIANWGHDEAKDKEQFTNALSALSRTDTSRTDALIGSICTAAVVAREDEHVDLQFSVAHARLLTYRHYVLADKLARDRKTGSPLTLQIKTEFERAQNLVRQIRDLMVRNPRCQGHLEQFSVIPKWTAFADTDAGVTRSARVYQVGPREQAQQISSVARAANSLALAASIAGSAPTGGLAADAAASYSRQAMGRADALERASLVSGYAVGGKQAFGWVIGPRALLDPRGHVQMEQIAKTYDVWVDLSVPGWWSDFDLETTSVWAPSPQSIAAGRLSAGDGGSKQRIKVRLGRTPSDYDAITEFLLGNLPRRLEITDVQGGPVNACAPTTLWIRGNHLWRAESVFVLGQLLTRDKFTSTPDMKGIMVTVPALATSPNVNLSRTVSVMTSLGPALWPKPIEYLAEPSGEACKSGKPASGGTPSDAVTIGEIKPVLDFVVPAKFSIQATGTNLKKVVRVELHGQPGALKVAADGKSLSVDFDEASTSAIPASDNITLDFLDSDKKNLAARRVRIQRAQ